MAYSRKQIGFIFEIETSSVFYANPEKKEVVNSFDLIGDLVSLRRNKEEKNLNYKWRIADVNVNPGSAVYTGVINNLLRDLSLNRYKAFTIDTLKDGNGVPLASNPRVEILANKIILYEDWIPGKTPTIELEIRTYKREDPGYYLDELIEYINDYSTYFTASKVTAKSAVPTSNLIRISSTAEMTDELIQPDYRTKLAGSNLIENTIELSEKSVFKNEVATLVEAGDYTIDRANGMVTNFSLPSGNSFISYMYNIFPLEVEHCDIQLFTLNDDDFVTELFDKETSYFGEEVDGLLNPEGAEIYHAVYKGNKVFWGK